MTAKTTMNRLKKLKEEQAAAIALEKKNWATLFDLKCSGYQKNYTQHPRGIT